MLKCYTDNLQKASLDHGLIPVTTIIKWSSPASRMGQPDAPEEKLAPRQTEKPKFNPVSRLSFQLLEIEGLEKPISMSKQLDKYTMWIILEFKYKTNGYNNSCENWKF